MDMTTSNVVIAPQGREKTRDLRIDAIRGLALLVIFSDHIRGNPIRAVTLVGFGFADIAEIFVFLTGYISGVAYGRRYVLEGYWRCQLRASVRCAQVYAACIAMTLLAMALTAAWQAWRPGTVEQAGVWFGSPPPFSAAELPRLFTLAFTPINFCVLVLYVALFSALPAMLAIYRRSPLAMVALTFGLYVVVQFAPDSVALPLPFSRAFYFNPFAWQFLFFIGVALGAAGDQGKKWIPRNRLAVLSAAIGIELAVLAGLYYEPSTLPYVDKPTLGVLRLVHFGCLVVAGRAFMSMSASVLRSPFLHPLILCGQHPLVVYCSGGLLAIVGSLCLETLGRHLALIALINLSGWALCVCAAACSAWLRPGRPFSQSAAPHER